MRNVPLLGDEPLTISEMTAMIIRYLCFINEKAAAFGICIKDTGLTPCECVSDANLTKPKIDESPLKDKPKEPTVKVSDDSKTSTDNKPVKKTENKSEPKQVENNKSVERTNKPVKDIESVLNSTHINKDSGVDLKTETTLTQTSTTTGSISKTDSSSSTNLSGGPSSSLTGIEEKSEVDTKESQTSRPGPTNVAYQEAMAEQERAETEAAGQAAANKYFEDLAKYGISPQQVNKTDSELNPAYR